MLSDIEIAQANQMKHITEIAGKVGLTTSDIEQYGDFIAKIKYETIQKQANNPQGKLILVTAINPTPAGEGKTTTSIGLADGLNLIGKKTMLALREPSLGPVFGMKGGAAGGGLSQVLPMEDLNLHFTGDFHAIGSANNLLCAMLDNHIHFGNALRIDTRSISIRRCVDMNDRQLRFITDGLGGKSNGFPREDGFDITVASEVMAILCLARDLEDLKERLSNIVVGYNLDGAPVTAGDLKAHGAMATLLKNAIKPNLVQTIGGTPTLIHGGPFANIAHGCNSVIATKLALSMADYVVTEAGFGADLGTEKFLNIKCRESGLKPHGAVIVATIRALKYNGGINKNELGTEDLSALEKGLPNLLRHYENITKTFGVPAVIAINQFPTDTQNEIDFLLKKYEALGIKIALSQVWEKGGEGGKDLATAISEVCDDNATPSLTHTYELTDSIESKIKAVVTKIYHGAGVELSATAKRQIKKLEKLGFTDMPICMAKTQYSFSDNPSLLGAPEDFTVQIKEIRLSAGAGFIVILAGDILTMPGLPKVPAAENIDISSDGKITGLF